MKVVVACALLLLAVGCSGRGVACERADVERFEDRCRVQVPFAGAPTYGICFSAGLGPPAGFDFLGPDVEACSAHGAGELMSCMAARASECRSAQGEVDRAAVDALLASCPRQFSPFASLSSSGLCAACQQGLDRCLAGCATSSWEACARCEATCQRDFARCCD